MISQTTINEYKTAVKEEFGVVLDDKEACEILFAQVAYFDLLAKIFNR